jgi:hypothetical protein
MYHFASTNYHFDQNRTYNYQFYIFCPIPSVRPVMCDGQRVTCRLAHFYYEIAHRYSWLKMEIPFLKNQLILKITSYWFYAYTLIFLVWNTSNAPEFLFHSTLICAAHFALFGFTPYFTLNTQNPRTTFNPHAIFEHQNRPTTTTNLLQITLFVGRFLEL